MTTLGERNAEGYWEKLGLRAERFDPEEVGKGKTPDFRIFSSSELVAFSEAKHVQHDNWLDKQLEAAGPLEIVGGLRRDPIFNRIVGHIHKAYRQFKAVNHEHKYPNVLIFTNSDKGCDSRDLVVVMTGKFFVEGGGWNLFIPRIPKAESGKRSLRSTCTCG